MDELEPRRLFSVNLLSRVATDNTLATADNLGTLAGLTQVNQQLSTADNVDFFRFTLSSSANLLARLDGLSAGAKIQLMKITAGKGVVLRGSPATVQSAGQISLRRIPAGSYAVKISGKLDTDYQLSLTADYAGSTRPTSANLGVVSKSVTTADFVGSADPSDMYRFVLGTTRNINISLNPATDNADLVLTNAAGRTLVASHQTGTTPDGIFAGLHAGVYYLSVLHVTGDTNYGLSITPS